MSALPADIRITSAFTDEQLWDKINMLHVPDLKALLAKGNVPTTAIKQKLQWRLFYAIRLGKLQHFDTLIVNHCVLLPPLS